MVPKARQKSKPKMPARWLSEKESRTYLGLFEGVLARAAHDLKQTHTYINPAYASIGNQTRRWFMDDSDEHPFSFINCCRVLAYSPERIREEIKPYMEPIIPKRVLEPARERFLRKEILERLKKYGALNLSSMFRARAPKKIRNANSWELRETIKGLIHDKFIEITDPCKAPKFTKYAITKKGELHLWKLEILCRESDT